jgi:hypothetical protein
MGNLPTGFTNVLLIFIYFIFKKIKNYQFNYKLVLTNQKKSFIISSINNNIVYKKFSFWRKKWVTRQENGATVCVLQSIITI